MSLFSFTPLILLISAFCSGVDPASNVAESEALAAGDQLENDDHLVLNQATRALLMAKLQREGHEADQTQISTQIQQSGIITTPSKCLVIQNAFDAAAEDAKPGELIQRHFRRL